MGNVERRDGWATQGEEVKRGVWSICSGEALFYRVEARPWGAGQVVDDNGDTVVEGVGS
jgi:hypothetical protein